MNLNYTLGKYIHPNFEWRVETSENVVYITFDDGPHPRITPWVLDVLEQYNAKGSFFVVGENAQRYPQLIKELEGKGHSIGNHTQHHLKGWSVSSEEYLADIEECNKHIPSTTLFRPPYGRINTRSISKLKDYRVIMWDNLSRDYLKGLDKEASLERLRKYTVPGSLIVFHDSEKAEDNLRYLLPKYLEFLKTSGFVAKAL